MTDDMVSRDALRELLFDGVAPPTGTDAMFDVTFAAQGPHGAELLPPDGLFDLPADDPADDPAFDEAALDDVPLDDVPLGDPAFDDPAFDGPAFDDPTLDGAGTDGAAHDTAAGDEPGPDHGAADPHDGTGPDPLDPGTGW